MSGHPALERHLQGLDGHVPVVHRADGPPHDEPREQIQDRREVQFAAAADDELGRVADPPLIRGVRFELAVEQIRRDRLVVIAHGGYFVTLPGPCDQAFSCISRTTRLRLTCSSARSGLRECAGCHSAVYSRQRTLGRGPSTAGRLVIVPIPGVVATRRTRCV